MFGTLKAGSLLYILSKGENPSLSIGQVVSVTPPRPKVNNTFMPIANPIQMEQVIDINVKVGDDNKIFSNVSTNLSIVDTGINNYVISDDKTAIMNEVEAFGTTSQNILNSVPYHQKVVESCKRMMIDLNPNLQKEAEREQEMLTMKNELAEMRTAMGEITSLLKGVFNSNNKTRKE